MLESIIFSQDKVSEWIKLSDNYVHSSNINLVKNRIDNYNNHFRRYGTTYILSIAKSRENRYNALTHL